MNVQTVPLSTILPDPVNLRDHPADNIDNIKASLTLFGQQKPLVVDSHGIIRAGNGTYRAAQELGWSTIDVVVSELEGVMAQAYSIADNRSTDKSKFREDELGYVLKAMQDEEQINMLAVGFTAKEINALLPETLTTPTDVGITTIPATFQLLVDCESEAHQRELYDRFTQEDLKCRVLTL